jgi:probable rRNA maturation factor
VIEVQTDERFHSHVQAESLHSTALSTLVHQRVGGPVELAIVVTSDDVLRDLNCRHRDVDAPTDVLAFPDETQGPFVAAPGLPRYLGDVIISFPRAEVQAAEAGHSVQAELQLLAIHGVLHLLGYDDTTEGQRAEMWTVQSEILHSMGIEVNLPA